MNSRLKQVKLNDYRVTRIRESQNNRLVDLGDSFLALLDDVPRYPNSSSVSAGSDPKESTARTKGPVVAAARTLQRR